MTMQPLTAEMERKTMTNLTGLPQAMFAPRSVALVGASAVEGKHTSLPQRFLRMHGYDGPIYPINPGREEIAGERAYPAVSAVGAEIDHALIMVPSSAVEAAVDDCVRAGVRCATILSNGFAETGAAGAQRQQDLVARARAGNMRILGPNSLGLVNPLDKVALSANEVLSLPKLPTGSTALVSQSGSMLGALLSRGTARGLGFSRMVSIGNEADISLCETAEWLIDDDATRVILLFLETMRDAPAFRRMAARAHSRNKPLVAFRLGRSAVGSQLSASHTGAMVGGGAALDSLLRDSGVICVDHLDTLLEMPRLVANRRPGAGRRVAVVTTTGGGGGLIVDPLSNRGAHIVVPSEAVRSNLAQQGVNISDSPLIDLTLAGANAKTYGAVLHELMTAPECDLVVAVVGSSAQFRPDRAVHPIIEACKEGAAKPVLVFIAPDAPQTCEKLAQAGIPSFSNPDVCADAALAFLKWRAPRMLPRQTLSNDVQQLLASAPQQLNATESQTLFGALGIPQAREFVLPVGQPWSREQLEQLPFPVVAKILSAAIAHKSDVGGVALGIPDADALLREGQAMIERVRQHTRAPLDGIQVQAMHQGVAELLVGYHHDPASGPMISVGIGGVMTEIHRDVAMRPAPVDPATAREMIDELRGAALLHGFRGRPVGDIEAAAQAVASLSTLALQPGQPISDAEINPLLVKPAQEGCVAVDGLVVLKPRDEDAHA